MTFSHLHVASGYSLQYGTATPQAIAEREGGEEEAEA